MTYAKKRSSTPIVAGALVSFGATLTLPLALLNLVISAFALSGLPQNPDPIEAWIPLSFLLALSSTATGCFLFKAFHERNYTPRAGIQAFKDIIVTTLVGLGVLLLTAVAFYMFESSGSAGVERGLLVLSVPLSAALGGLVARKRAREMLEESVPLSEQ